ncbi:MAG: TIGR03915 family putative DNA repair protein [Bacilli bacterium]|nr:TIGR03915 family putative DNA repair protein [Bacilli bacterium]
MEKVYIYDGSFKSLIILIITLLKNNIKPNNIKKDGYNVNIFEELIYLEINEKINIYKTIHHFEILKTCFNVYLSLEENKELIIFYFLLNYKKYKEKVIYLRNLKCVSETLRISNYVKHEAHRFKGFVRFKELDNKVLYAEIEPDNNILPLIKEHFEKRLSKELWIIKDTKRNLLCIYDKKQSYLVSEDEFKLLNLNLSKTEKEIEILWQEFYKTIGIKERKNERCRMNFMPKKYWKNILEVSDEL